jgi:hypothetical protein
MRAGILLFLGFLSCPATGWSQAQVRGPAPSILFRTVNSQALPETRVRALPDSVQRRIEPTHWQEGALVGGVVGGVLGGLLGHALCGLSDEYGKDCTGTTVGGFLVGAVLLGFPGALIGGQFPKRRDAPEQRSTREDD